MVGNDQRPHAEVGNTLPEDMTGSGAQVTGGFDRVRFAAEKDKSTRFTALLHHVTPGLLKEGFEALNYKATPGIDGCDMEEYELDLEQNILDLWNKVQGGTYKAQPSVRSYIPKADGSKRPLGIPTIEDKIIQSAVRRVMSAIYEADFLECSYGFRPGLNCHNALDSLYLAITTKKVSWVLDADITKFFDSISHEWMIRFLEHRIADKRVLALTRQWLDAGVMNESGELERAKYGTPQGGAISPLLANVFLHYALDMWVSVWSKKKAKGEIYFVRYADDFVGCFQYKDDADRFLEELKERLAKFELSLHPDKTRLIEFGRFAAENRRGRGQKKPETFDFLGFTHICSKTRKNGKFKLLRLTITKRWRAKLKGLKIELRYRINDSIEKIGKWLRSVLRGYYGYHAIHDNMATLGRFRHLLVGVWIRTVRRKSGKARMIWDKFAAIVKKWLPIPKVVHPYPNQRRNVII
ncbi:MAG: group II intron reverse transcriptase/maturase [Deltaproteobacteria bacterium]|jgi:group II intron reverse transcriptase/maturase|nr:group II intron reverse transcriptase/maturase [Deltaproteobacteria bacterium]